MTGCVGRGKEFSREPRTQLRSQTKTRTQSRRNTHVGHGQRERVGGEWGGGKMREQRGGEVWWWV